MTYESVSELWAQRGRGNPFRISLKIKLPFWSHWNISWCFWCAWIFSEIIHFVSIFYETSSLHCIIKVLRTLYLKLSGENSLNIYATMFKKPNKTWVWMRFGEYFALQSLWVLVLPYWFYVIVSDAWPM